MGNAGRELGMNHTDNTTLLAIAAVMLSLAALFGIFAMGVSADLRASRQRKTRSQLQRAIIARRRAWNWLMRKPGNLRLTDRSASEDRNRVHRSG